MGVQREYAMTRIRAGDYILPSNDAATLWRLTRSDELDTETALLGQFWDAAYFDGTLEQAQALVALDVDEFLDWSHWITAASYLKTRREAIEAALTATTITARDVERAVRR